MKQTGFSVLVLSPFEVKDHRGEPYKSVDRAVGDDSRLILLPNCPEIFRAGEATLSLIEKKVFSAHLGFDKDFLEKLDGVIVFLHHSMSDIIDPLAKYFVDDQIFWYICGHMTDRALRGKLKGLGHTNPKILRRNTCTDPRLTGEMLRQFSWKDGKEITFDNPPRERLVKAGDDLVRVN